MGDADDADDDDDDDDADVHIDGLLGLFFSPLGPFSRSRSRLLVVVFGPAVVVVFFFFYRVSFGSSPRSLVVIEVVEVFAAVGSRVFPVI